MGILLRYTLIALTLVTMVGCTSTATYNPGYEARDQYPSESLPGRALILTDTSDDSLTLSQSPSSFTGGGTTINVQVGQIIKQVATNVFDALFEGGAASSNDPSAAAEYTVVVKPTHGSLDFEYDSLENVGFAITPKATVTIRVEVSDPSGDTLIENVYSSGVVAGDTYVASSEPSEKINKVIHVAVGRAIAEAARDLRTKMDD